MTKYLLPLCFTIFALSCEDQAKDNTLFKGINIQNADSLVIKIHPPMLSTYSTKTSIYVDGKLDYILAYNDKMHQIEKIKFDKNGIGELVNTTLLKTEGPESISEVKYIEYIGTDSLLLASQFNINIFNLASQKWLYKYHIPSKWPEIEDKQAKFHEPKLKSKTGHLGKFLDDGRFLFQLSYYGSSQFGDLDFFQKTNYLFGILNLKTSDVELLDVHYPERFTENLFGRMGEVTCTFDDKYIYYGMAGFPEIFRYDYILNKNASQLPIKSISFPAPKPIAAGQDLHTHTEGEILFGNIYVNSFSNKIYRRYSEPFDQNYPNRVRIKCVEYTEDDIIDLEPTMLLYSPIFTKDGMYANSLSQDEDYVRYYRVD